MLGEYLKNLDRHAGVAALVLLAIMFGYSLWAFVGDVADVLQRRRERLAEQAILERLHLEALARGDHETVRQVEITAAIRGFDVRKGGR